MIIRTLTFITALSATGLVACSSGEHSPAAEGAHGEMATADYERGPNRGRMLRAGDFALELQIFESGVPPEFHVYLYRDGQLLPPDSAEVSVELLRLGDIVDRFAFKPQGDYLLGDGVVTEPHSFGVTVKAQIDGQKHEWSFDSYEGRTTIATDIAEEAGIRTEVAGPASIADTVSLNGRIVPDPQRVVELAARYPGEIDSVPVALGDAVEAGAVLAHITSNDSLRSYAITAPFAGRVIALHARPGEQASKEALIVIADYSQLWVELALYPRDLQKVKTGQTVSVKAADADLSATVSINQLLPVMDGAAVYHAHAAIDNTEGRWHPGQFLTGQVRVAQTQVPLAVKRSGLQGFRDFTVVFAQVDETYEVRMLDLGRQDETYVEVLGGLEPGTHYVTENSFLLKADVEKDGASHDH